MAGFIRERAAGWFDSSFEKRLEAAREDNLAERIRPYTANHGYTFLCNLCRETLKNTRPEGFTESPTGYTILLFCKPCMQKIHATW